MHLPNNDRLLWDIQWTLTLLGGYAQCNRSAKNAGQVLVEMFLSPSPSLTPRSTYTLSAPNIIFKVSTFSEEMMELIPLSFYVVIVI